MTVFLALIHVWYLTVQFGLVFHYCNDLDGSGLLNPYMKLNHFKNILIQLIDGSSCSTL